MALTSTQQFMDAVKRGNRILVTFCKDWNGDAVATSLAISHILRRQGKIVDIVADGFRAPNNLSFLPGCADIKPSLSQLAAFVITLDVSATKLDQLSYDLEGDKLRIRITPKAGQFEQKNVTTSTGEYKYDLVITVGAPDYVALGKLFETHADFFYAQPTINIDHNPMNERYGNINIVDITATSCAEVVHALFTANGKHFLDEDVATCLLTGMISATRSFKTATVTPNTLNIASRLISAGGKREDVVRNLYRTRPLSTLKLWGRALSRLKFDPVTKTAWTMLLRHDFTAAGDASEDHLAEVIDELMMNSPEAEIVALLYEQELKTAAGNSITVCGLVSSEKHADSLGLVATLSPTGNHALARLCFPNASILEVEKTVLHAITTSLNKRSTAVMTPATTVTAATPPSPNLPQA